MRTTAVFAILCLAAVLLLCGCISDQTRADIGTVEQSTYNAAASLPPSPQVTAIEANAVTVAQAVGYPITLPTTAPAVAGATP